MEVGRHSSVSILYFCMALFCLGEREGITSCCVLSLSLSLAWHAILALPSIILTALCACLCGVERKKTEGSSLACPLTHLLLPSSEPSLLCERGGRRLAWHAVCVLTFFVPGPASCIVVLCLLSVKHRKMEGGWEISLCVAPMYVCVLYTLNYLYPVCSGTLPVCVSAAFLSSSPFCPL